MDVGLRFTKDVRGGWCCEAPAYFGAKACKPTRAAAQAACSAIVFRILAGQLEGGFFDEASADVRFILAEEG